MSDDTYVPVVLTQLPALRSTVFVLERRMSGSWRHRAGTVVDLNDHLKAVKVKYAVGPKTIKHVWFPLTQLTDTAPANEKK